MNTSANKTSKWNAEDYTQNSLAQKTWADELIVHLDQTYRATMHALESLPDSELDQSHSALEGCVLVKAWQWLSMRYITAANWRCIYS